MTILVALIWFVILFPVTVFAATPQLSSPTNSSTVSNSSLNWQAVEEASQYRVIVDDESGVSSPYLKNYYASKTSYSPKLPDGTYYWKVGAKDQSGNWSWSEVWSFTLINSGDSQEISQSENKPTSTFLISNVPKEISSSEVFKVSISLVVPKSPNSKFFLKGAFKKSGESNYFGFTKNSDWVKNGEKFSEQFPINVDGNGNWSGDLEVKPDSEDSGFEGSGEYKFKVGRYSETGSGPIWSNEETININEVKALPSPSLIIKIASSSPKIVEKINESSVAGESTELPEIKESPLVAGESTEKTGFNIFILFGIILIGFGAGFSVYFYIRNRT